jgi:hypothetical protein
MDGRSKVLFASYYREDTLTTLRIAASVERHMAVQPVFLLTSAGEDREDASRVVRERGFPVVEDAPPTESVPSGGYQVQALTRARRRWADALLQRVAPKLIVCTNDAAQGQLLIAAEARSVPSLFVQWTDTWSRSMHLKMSEAEARWNDRQRPWFRRLRRRVARRIEIRAGLGLRWPFDNHATRLALAGPFYLEMCRSEGIRPDRLVVAGNPQCDDIYHASRLGESDHGRLRKRLGLEADQAFLLYAAEHTDRIRHLSAASASESVRAILEGMRLAHLTTPRVVKLHPKQGDDYAQFIRSLDPEAVVLDGTTDLGPLIAASKLVVSTLSSSLLWAVGIGRPAVSAFFWTGVDELRAQRVWSGVDCVDSPDQLVASLRRQTGDSAQSESWSRRRLECRDHFLKVDGRSTERLTEECARLMAVPQPVLASDGVIA